MVNNPPPPQQKFQDQRIHRKSCQWSPKDNPWCCRRTRWRAQRQLTGCSAPCCWTSFVKKLQSRSASVSRRQSFHITCSVSIATVTTTIISSLTYCVLSVKLNCCCLVYFWKLWDSLQAINKRLLLNTLQNSQTKRGNETGYILTCLSYHMNGVLIIITPPPSYCFLNWSPNTIRWSITTFERNNDLSVGVHVANARDESGLAVRGGYKNNDIDSFEEHLITLPMLGRTKQEIPS